MPRKTTRGAGKKKKKATSKSEASKQNGKDVSVQETTNDDPHDVEPVSKKAKKVVAERVKHMATSGGSGGGDDEDGKQLHRLLLESLRNRDSAITWVLKISRYLSSRCEEGVDEGGLEENQNLLISLFMRQLHMSPYPSALLVQYLRQTLSSHVIHPVSFFYRLCDRNRVEDGRGAWLIESNDGDDEADEEMDGNICCGEDQWRLASWNEYVLLICSMLPELLVTSFSVVDKDSAPINSQDTQDIVIRKTMFRSSINQHFHRENGGRNSMFSKSHSVTEVSHVVILCIRLLFRFLYQCNTHLMEAISRKNHMNWQQRRRTIMQDLERSGVNCATSLHRLMKNVRISNMLAIARVIHVKEWQQLCQIEERIEDNLTRLPNVKMETKDGTGNHSPSITQFQHRFAELCLSLRRFTQRIDGTPASPLLSVTQDNSPFEGLTFFIEEQLSFPNLNSASTERCMEKLLQNQRLYGIEKSILYLELYRAGIASIRVLKSQCDSTSMKHHINLRKSLLLSKFPVLIKKLEKQSDSTTLHKFASALIQYLYNILDDDDDDDDNNDNDNASNEINHGDGDLLGHGSQFSNLAPQILASLIHANLIGADRTFDMKQAAVSASEFAPLLSENIELSENFDLMHYLTCTDVFNQREHLGWMVKYLESTTTFTDGVRFLLRQVLKTPSILDLFQLHDYLSPLLRNLVKMAALLCGSPGSSVPSTMHGDFSSLVTQIFVICARCGIQACSASIVQAVDDHVSEKEEHLLPLRRLLLKIVFAPSVPSHTKEYASKNIEDSRIQKLLSQLRECVSMEDKKKKELDDVKQDLKSSLSPLQLLDVVPGMLKQLLDDNADSSPQDMSTQIGLIFACFVDIFGQYADILLAQEMSERMTISFSRNRRSNLEFLIAEEYAKQTLHRRKKNKQTEEGDDDARPEYLPSSPLILRTLAQHSSTDEKKPLATPLIATNTGLDYVQEHVQMLMHDQQMISRFPSRENDQSVPSRKIITGAIESLKLRLYALAATMLPMDVYGTSSDCICSIRDSYATVGGESFTFSLIKEIARAMHVETAVRASNAAELCGFILASMAGPHQLARYLNNCISQLMYEESLPAYGQLLARFTVVALAYSHAYIQEDNVQYHQFLDMVMIFLETAVHRKGKSGLSVSSIFALNFVEMASLVPDLVRTPLLEQQSRPKTLLKLLHLYGTLCPAKKRTICFRFFDLETEMERELSYLLLDRQATE